MTAKDKKVEETVQRGKEDQAKENVQSNDGEDYEECPKRKLTWFKPPRVEKRWMSVAEPVLENSLANIRAEANEQFQKRRSAPIISADQRGIPQPAGKKKKSNKITAPTVRKKIAVAVNTKKAATKMKGGQDVPLRRDTARSYILQQRPKGDSSPDPPKPKKQVKKSKSEKDNSPKDLKKVKSQSPKLKGKDVSRKSDPIGYRKKGWKLVTGGADGTNKKQKRGRSKSETRAKRKAKKHEVLSEIVKVDTRASMHSCGKAEDSQHSIADEDNDECLKQKESEESSKHSLKRNSSQKSDSKESKSRSLDWESEGTVLEGIESYAVPPYPTQESISKGEKFYRFIPYGFERQLNLKGVKTTKFSWDELTPEDLIKKRRLAKAKEGQSADVLKESQEITKERAPYVLFKKQYDLDDDAVDYIVDEEAMKQFTKKVAKVPVLRYEIPYKEPCLEEDQYYQIQKQFYDQSALDLDDVIATVIDPLAYRKAVIGVEDNHTLGDEMSRKPGECIKEDSKEEKERIRATDRVIFDVNPPNEDEEVVLSDEIELDDALPGEITGVAKLKKFIDAPTLRQILADKKMMRNLDMLDYVKGRKIIMEAQKRLQRKKDKLRHRKMTCADILDRLKRIERRRAKETARQYILEEEYVDDIPIPPPPISCNPTLLRQVESKGNTLGLEETYIVNDLGMEEVVKGEHAHVKSPENKSCNDCNKEKCLVRDESKENVRSAKTKETTSPYLTERPERKTVGNVLYVDMSDDSDTESIHGVFESREPPVLERTSCPYKHDFEAVTDEEDEEIKSYEEESEEEVEEKCSEDEQEKIPFEETLIMRDEDFLNDDAEQHRFFVIANKDTDKSEELPLCKDACTLAMEGMEKEVIIVKKNPMNYSFLKRPLATKYDQRLNLGGVPYNKFKDIFTGRDIAIQKCGSIYNGQIDVDNILTEWGYNPEDYEPKTEEFDLAYFDETTLDGCSSVPYELSEYLPMKFDRTAPYTLHQRMLSHYQDSIMCQFCREPLNDPRLLSCLHTFCHHCVTTKFKTAEGNRVVYCYTCQAKTDVLKHGLPRAHFLNKMSVQLLRILKYQTFPRCSMLKKKDPNHVCEMATVQCTTCQKVFCEACFDHHRNAIGNEAHQTPDWLGKYVDYNDVGIDPAHFCHKHCTEKIKYFCVTCNIGICCICIKYHPHHAIENFPTDWAKDHIAIINDKCLKKLNKAHRYLAEIKMKIDFWKAHNLSSLYRRLPELIEQRKMYYLRQFQKIFIEDNIERHKIISAQRKRMIKLLRYTVSISIRLKTIHCLHPEMMKYFYNYMVLPWKLETFLRNCPQDMYSYAKYNKNIPIEIYIPFRFHKPKRLLNMIRAFDRKTVDSLIYFKDILIALHWNSGHDTDYFVFCENLQEEQQCQCLFRKHCPKGFRISLCPENEGKRDEIFYITIVSRRTGDMQLYNPPTKKGIDESKDYTVTTYIYEKRRDIKERFLAFSTTYSTPLDNHLPLDMAYDHEGYTVSTGHTQEKQGSVWHGYLESEKQSRDGKNLPITTATGYHLVAEIKRKHRGRKVNTKDGHGWPHYVALGRDEFIYVSDLANNRIRLYNRADLVEARSFYHKKPYGIALDKNSNIYMASPSTNEVVRYDKTGTWVQNVLDKDDGLVYPICLQFDRKDENKLIVGCGDGFVRIYEIELEDMNVFPKEKELTRKKNIYKYDVGWKSIRNDFVPRKSRIHEVPPSDSENESAHGSSTATPVEDDEDDVLVCPKRTDIVKKTEPATRRIIIKSDGSIDDSADKEVKEEDDYCMFEDDYKEYEEGNEEEPQKVPPPQDRQDHGEHRIVLPHGYTKKMYLLKSGQGAQKENVITETLPVPTPINTTDMERVEFEKKNLEGIEHEKTRGKGQETVHSPAQKKTDVQKGKDDKPKKPTDVDKEHKKYHLQPSSKLPSPEQDESKIHRQRKLLQSYLKAKKTKLDDETQEESTADPLKAPTTSVIPITVEQPALPGETSITGGKTAFVRHREQDRRQELVKVETFTRDKNRIASSVLLDEDDLDNTLKHPLSQQQVNEMYIQKMQPPGVSVPKQTSEDGSDSVTSEGSGLVPEEWPETPPPYSSFTEPPIADPHLPPPYTSFIEDPQGGDGPPPYTSFTQDDDLPPPYTSFTDHTQISTSKKHFTKPPKSQPSYTPYRYLGEPKLGAPPPGTSQPGKNGEDEEEKRKSPRSSRPQFHYRGEPKLGAPPPGTSQQGEEKDKGKATRRKRSQSESSITSQNSVDLERSAETQTQTLPTPKGKQKKVLTKRKKVSSPAKGATPSTKNDDTGFFSHSSAEDEPKEWVSVDLSEDIPYLNAKEKEKISKHYIPDMPYRRPLSSEDLVTCIPISDDEDGPIQLGEEHRQKVVIRPPPKAKRKRGDVERAESPEEGSSDDEEISIKFPRDWDKNSGIKIGLCDVEQSFANTVITALTRCYPYSWVDSIILGPCFERLLESNGGQTDLKDLFTNIRQNTEYRFEGGRHEYPHEFLHALLSEVHKRTEQLKVSDANKAFTFTKWFHTNCCACDSGECIESRHYYLNLTLDKYRILQEYNELPRESDLRLCPQCTTPQMILKRTEVNPQMYFIINVERFDEKGKMDDTEIKISNTLRLISHPEKWYELFAVIEHHGSQKENGKYTIFGKYPNELQWRMYSEDGQSKVKDMPNETSLSNNACMLFYVEADKGKIVKPKVNVPEVMQPTPKRDKKAKNPVVHPPPFDIIFEVPQNITPPTHAKETSYARAWLRAFVNLTPFDWVDPKTKEILENIRLGKQITCENVEAFIKTMNGALSGFTLDKLYDALEFFRKYASCGIDQNIIQNFKDKFETRTNITKECTQCGLNTTSVTGYHISREMAEINQEHFPTVVHRPYDCPNCNQSTKKGYKETLLSASKYLIIQMKIFDEHKQRKPKPNKYHVKQYLPMFYGSKAYRLKSCILHFGQKEHDQGRYMNILNLAKETQDTEDMFNLVEYMDNRNTGLVLNKNQLETKLNSFTYIIIYERID